MGPLRVWRSEKESPGLAMTRSIGDTNSQEIGIIDSPDIKKYILNGSDAFMVLASDGVWDVLSNEKVG